MRSLVEQLRDAFEKSGLTVQQLLALSGLRCQRAALHKKIYGQRVLRTDEAEALAVALNVPLRWNILTPSRRRAA